MNYSHYNIGEKIRRMDADLLKNNKMVQNMPYYKVFSFQERTAAKCDGEVRCHLCNAVLFYTDIMNFDDMYFPLLPNMICARCKKTYKRSYDKKKWAFIKNERC